MPKNIFQDIVKIKNPNKPTINEKKAIFDNLEIKQKKNISYNMLWLIAFISVIFLFFAISLLFFNAKVTITPKTKDFLLDKTFVATKSVEKDGLSYDLIILSDEESKEVLGGEEKDYLEKAKGVVLLYNAFSSSPQPLSIDTRLEGSNGKIYKTKTKIIVPGKTKDNLPGKIEVEIYGAEPGEEYNSAPIDFKILGFKGTAKYSKFYGRSVGEIKGGLKGKSRQISESEKEKIIKELKENLFLKLLQKAKNQIPERFVLLKDASFFEVAEAELIPSKNEGSFIVKIKGTFNGIIFNKEKLAKEVINVVLDKKDNSAVELSNLEDLSFLKSEKDSFTLKETEEITFSLVGTAKIIWKVDPEMIIAELLGKNKKDFNQILLKYPNIESASLKIKPVWKNSFPAKSEDIKIIITSLK